MNLSIKKKSNQNMKIGVLMGGFGEERGVSLLSGQNVRASLIKNHYHVIKIDPKENLLEILQVEKPDVILNLLHGPFGEDGTIQAILEYLRIPFVGETPLSSGLAMHKIRTKEVLKSYGIRTAPYFNFYHYLPHSLPSVQVIYDEIIGSGLSQPFFFKDAIGGSSMGVWRIKNGEDLAKILPTTDFAQNPGRFFAEEGITGREVSVGVYRSTSGIQILPIAEIETEEEFFNFSAKYNQKNTHEIIPAKLPERIVSNLNSLVTEIYNVMQFRGCVRIDFILDNTAKLEPVVLEINNQPGMTKSSLIPMMLVEQGIPMTDFLLEQIESISKYPKPNF